MKSFLVVMMVFLMISPALYAQEVKYGGVLKIGLSSGLTLCNYNPWSAGSTLYGAQLIYEPLVIIDPLTGSETPWLAESYEWQNDNLDLVLHLRENAKWSDGVPFTAEDVVFTFNMLKDYPAMDLANFWDGTVDSVIAEDPYTVVIKFKEPNVLKFYTIVPTLIVPEHIWSEVEDPPTFANPDPVGSGPFLFESFDSTLAMETYVKNEDYWQEGKPYIDGIEITNYKTNETNLAAISSGQLDWSSSFVPDVEKVFISRDPENHRAWITQGAAVALHSNLTNYPFDIREFRKAMAMAIDKERVAKLAAYDYTPPAHPTALQPGHIEEWFYEPLEPLLYSYDPDESIAILEALGLERDAEGFFINPQTNQPFSFEITVVSGWTDWVQAANLISEDLKAIGIKANVNPVAYGQYAQSLYNGMFDFILGGPGAQANPYFYYNFFLNSENTAPTGEPAYAGNFERWIDPVSDVVLDLFKKSTDMDVQKRAATVLERIMLTDIPVIPLFYTPQVELYSTKRFTNWPSEENPYNAGLVPWFSGVLLTTGLNVYLK